MDVWRWQPRSNTGTIFVWLPGEPRFVLCFQGPWWLPPHLAAAGGSTCPARDIWEWNSAPFSWPSGPSMTLTLLTFRLNLISHLLFCPLHLECSSLGSLPSWLLFIRGFDLDVASSLMPDGCAQALWLCHYSVFLATAVVSSCPPTRKQAPGDQGTYLSVSSSAPGPHPALGTHKMLDK